MRHSVPVMAAALEQVYNELLGRLLEQKEKVLHQLIMTQQQQGIHARNIYDNP
jgi:hypothetical protein